MVRGAGVGSWEDLRGGTEPPQNRLPYFLPYLMHMLGSVP